MARNVRRSSWEKCVYCGAADGTTRDHVPPKGLFGIPRPALVTVPCCEECRKGQSLDDEYFVRMLAIRHDVDTKAAATAMQAVHRAFLKPEKIGFTRGLLETMRHVPFYSPAGLYLGERTSYTVDLNRLCCVVERVVKGLYFHEFKSRVPDDCHCLTYSIDGFAHTDSDTAANVHRLIGAALSGQRRMFGNRVFNYWFQRLDGEIPVSLWALLVYGRVGFLAATMPETSTPNRSS